MSAKNNNRPTSIGGIIAAIVAVLLLVVLLNPNLLPVSGATKQSIGELVNRHFFIEGSGQMTAAHLLTLVAAICVLVVAYVVVKLILGLIGRTSPRAATICNLLAAFLKYLVWIIGFIWGLSILGVNTTAVLSGVGILGLVLGFGAQSLIEDVITGLFIIFEGQYEIGDIIILGDFRGTVRDVGVRTTTIEDAGGNLKVVNNSDIRNFQNRSKNMSKAICEVAVAYDTDIEAMEAALAEAFPRMYEEHRDLYAGQPQYLGIEELGTSGMTVKLAVPTAEENFFPAKRQLTRDVRLLFANSGVEIPFPQTVVHMAKE